MQKAEKDRENDEEVILEVEKEVAERRRANASNQDNPEEIETELRQIEAKIDADREALLEQVKEFQRYQEK